MSRDFLSVFDCVSILFQMLRTEQSHTTNLGSGIPTKIYEVATTIKAILNSSSEILISGDYRLGDIHSNSADTSKLFKEYPSFSPQPLEEGLRSYISDIFSSSTTMKSVFELAKRFDKSLLDAQAHGSFLQSYK